MLYNARKSFLTVGLGRCNSSKIGLVGKSLWKGKCQELLSIRLEGDLRRDISVMFLKPGTIQNTSTDL